MIEFDEMSPCTRPEKLSVWRRACVIPLMMVLAHGCAAQLGEAAELDDDEEREAMGQSVESLVTSRPDPACEGRSFRDITPIRVASPWTPAVYDPAVAGNEVMWLAERCAIAGYAVAPGIYDFRPRQHVTRAEFAALLGALIDDRAGRVETAAERALFPDVPSTHWARSHVIRAHRAGFMRGYPDGTFGPNRAVTRQEALVAIAAGMNMVAADVPSRHTFFPRFVDAGDVASWAEDGVLRGFRAGLLENEALLEIDGSLWVRPRHAASRADIASFIYEAFHSATHPRANVRSGTFPVLR